MCTDQHDDGCQDDQQPAPASLGAPGQPREQDHEAQQARTEGRDPEQLFRIVARTARKMSPEGRARVLEEFDLPQELAAAFAA